jgi:hypothetical protein
LLYSIWVFKTKDRGVTYALTLLTLAVVAYMQADLALNGTTLYGFGEYGGQ